MKITPMSHWLASLFVLTLAAGCDRSPRVTTTEDVDHAQRIEARAFQGEVYRSADGQNALTLISPDELELREGNTTLLCKYSKQAEALRVVVTALGTNQVIYFRFTNYGLQDNQGKVLLSPANYASAMEQARLVREREENARREALMRQQKIEEQKRHEQEELHQRSIAMRNDGMDVVRHFFSKGAVIKGYYAPLYRKESEPFQVAITDDVSFSPAQNDPYDQDFSVPGHMKWLGDSKEGHPFASSSEDFNQNENDGKFFGHVIVQRDGDKRELRVVAKFGVMDTNFHEFTARGNDSKWNGTDFAADFGDANRFYRAAGDHSIADGPTTAGIERETSNSALPLNAQGAETSSSNSTLGKKELFDRARSSDSKMAAIYSRLRSGLMASGKAHLKAEQLSWLKFRAEQTGSEELLSQGMNADTAALRRFTELNEQRASQLEISLQSIH